MCTARSTNLSGVSVEIERVARLELTLQVFQVLPRDRCGCSISSISIEDPHDGFLLARLQEFGPIGEVDDKEICGYGESGRYCSFDLPHCQYGSFVLLIDLR